jgi:hypothetical protein
MKTLAAGFVSAALALFSAQPANAYGDAPWCLKANVGVGFVQEICDFRTFEGCAAERPHFGSSSFCVQNSRYLPYWNGNRPASEPQRRHLRKRKN